MSLERDLVAHLASQFGATVVILYGSAATGEIAGTSDVDLVCFAAVKESFGESSTWRGLLLDAWIHPLEDADNTSDFLRLHQARVLLDHQGIGHSLLARVAAELSKPFPLLTAHELRHRNAWVWKMFDRAVRGELGGDYRRHWLLYDLPQTWCDMVGCRYLGPADAFRHMKEIAPRIYDAVETAMKPGSTIQDIQRAVVAVVGERDQITSQTRAD